MGDGVITVAMNHDLSQGSVRPGPDFNDRRVSHTTTINHITPARISPSCRGALRGRGQLTAVLRCSGSTSLLAKALSSSAKLQ